MTEGSFGQGTNSSNEFTSTRQPATSIEGSTVFNIPLESCNLVLTRRQYWRHVLVDFLLLNLWRIGPRVPLPRSYYRPLSQQNIAEWWRTSSVRIGALYRMSRISRVKLFSLVFSSCNKFKVSCFVNPKMDQHCSLGHVSRFSFSVFLLSFRYSMSVFVSSH